MIKTKQAKYNNNNNSTENNSDSASKLSAIDEVDDDNTISLIQKAKEKVGGGVQQITIPTKLEFERVPRYKRGQLNYESFTRLCELINSAAERKRLILEAPIEKLGPNAKLLLNLWKTQKTDDLGNLTFITDDDLKIELETDQNLKMNYVQSMWEILRHLLIIRVSETPDKKTKRYVFLR